MENLYDYLKDTPVPNTNVATSLAQNSSEEKLDSLKHKIIEFSSKDISMIKDTQYSYVGYGVLVGSLDSTNKSFSPNNNYSKLPKIVIDSNDNIIREGYNSKTALYSYENSGTGEDSYFILDDIQLEALIEETKDSIPENSTISLYEGVYIRIRQGSSDLYNVYFFTGISLSGSSIANAPIIETFAEGVFNPLIENAIKMSVSFIEISKEE